MVPPRLSAPNESSPLRGAIAIAKVGGGEETRWWDRSQVGDRELERALRGALDENGFLCPPGVDAPFTLEVFLVDLKQPMGIVSIVDSFIRYKLSSTRERRVIFDDVLSASYRLDVRDEYYGASRLRHTNEGSIRANLAAFISRLNELDVAGSR